MTSEEHDRNSSPQTAPLGLGQPERRRGRGGELAAAIIYGIITLGVTYAVSKPDQLALLVERLRARPPMPAAEARARRMIAELRADLAQIERGL